MQLRGYIEKIDLGADTETGLPNILVETAAEYHSLPAEEKKRAWCLVKTATQLFHLGPVRIYQLAAEGKLAAKTIRKNQTDRKGLKVLKIHNTVIDQAQVRQADKDRVLRRLKRAMRTVWWLNAESEQVLTFIVGLELNRVEASEFGSPYEQRDAQVDQYKTLEWLADTYRSAITDKFGAEEAARLIAEHVTPYDKWLEAKKLTKEGNNRSHEGN